MRGIVLLIAALPGVALAQPAPAPAPPAPVEDVTAIHDHAVALAKAGQLTEAVAEFKRAMAKEDQPKFECNMALALERLGELARAHARLSRCAPRLAAIDPTLARPKLDKLALLEGQLVTTHVPIKIEVSAGPATATISGVPDDEVMVLPTTMWLAPGTYALTVVFPGRRKPMTVAVEARAADVGRRQSVRVDTPAEEPIADEPERDPHPDEPHDVIGPEPVVPPVAPPRSRRTAAALLIGGGVAVAGGAVVHVLSRGKREHLSGLSGQAYDDYLPTWHRYQYGAIGLYGVGSVALGIGAYLYFRGSPVAVAPGPGGDGAMVSLTLAR